MLFLPMLPNSLGFACSKFSFMRLQSAHLATNNRKRRPNKYLAKSLRSLIMITHKSHRKLTTLSYQKLFSRETLGKAMSDFHCQKSLISSFLVAPTWIHTFYVERPPKSGLVRSGFTHFTPSSKLNLSSFILHFLVNC